jgi:hypothetical protein
MDCSVRLPSAQAFLWVAKTRLLHPDSLHMPHLRLAPTTAPPHVPCFHSDVSYCRGVWGTSAGMAFQSGVAAVGSTPHLALTWLVAVVLVACILLFLGMLSVEVWRSVQFARRVHAIRKASTASSPGGRASRPSRQYTDNPLNARRSDALPGLPASVAAAAVTGPQASRSDAGGQPPGDKGEAPGNARSPGNASGSGAWVLTVGRPPPPPPPREGNPGGGLHTTVGGTATAAVLDPRGLPTSRGPLLGLRAPPASSDMDRDGRVRRLRVTTAGASVFAAAGNGADGDVGH